MQCICSRIRLPIRKYIKKVSFSNFTLSLVPERLEIVILSHLWHKSYRFILLFQKSTMVSPPVMPINSRNVMHNTKSLNFSRTSLSVLGGGVAGILGLSSLFGIVFYFLASGILGLYYLGLNSRQDSLHFMNKQQLITAFVFENLFTYILMWTLMYGCVHVY